MRSTLLSRFPLEVLVLHTTDYPGRRYMDLIKSKQGASLAVQWLILPLQGAWVQSLAEILGSHMLQSVVNKQIFKKKPKQRTKKILLLKVFS